MLSVPPLDDAHAQRNKRDRTNRSRKPHTLIESRTHVISSLSLSLSLSDSRSSSLSHPLSLSFSLSLSLSFSLFDVTFISSFYSSHLSTWSPPLPSWSPFLPTHPLSPPSPAPLHPLCISRSRSGKPCLKYMWRGHLKLRNELSHKLGAPAGGTGGGLRGTRSWGHKLWAQVRDHGTPLCATGPAGSRHVY